MAREASSALLYIINIPSMHHLSLAYTLHISNCVYKGDQFMIKKWQNKKIEKRKPTAKKRKKKKEKKEKKEKNLIDFLSLPSYLVGPCAYIHSSILG